MSRVRCEHEAHEKRPLRCWGPAAFRGALMLEHAVGKTLCVVGFGKCVHSMWGSGWQVGH